MSDIVEAMRTLSRSAPDGEVTFDQLCNAIDEAATEIERLRTALRKCDRSLNYLIAESDAFLVNDLQKMIREALGDE